VSILIDKETKVIVQGATGRDGSFHTQQMVEYGTQIVAGVTPGKGGQAVHGVPVFNSVKEAINATGATASVIYVPARFAAAAIDEAADAGLKLIICITEGVPPYDMVETYHKVKKLGITLIGPNCPGLISPGKSKIGIMPSAICIPGRVGVISRSGTLTYEIIYALTELGIGQSTCIGIGGDPIVGSSPIDLLPMFEADDETDAMIVVGEIGGDEEERTAAFIKENIKKPCFAFIVGRSAPPGKTMGHAGAIISGGGKTGTADSKIEAYESVGVTAYKTMDDLAVAVKDKLS